MNNKQKIKNLKFIELLKDALRSIDIDVEDGEFTDSSKMQWIEATFYDADKNQYTIEFDFHSETGEFQRINLFIGKPEVRYDDIKRLVSSDASYNEPDSK